MDSIKRKAKLEELKANQSNQAMTGIPLRYKGSSRTEIVWRIPIVSSVFSIKSKIFYFLFKIALKIDEKPSVIPSKPTTLAENGYTFDGR